MYKKKYNKKHLGIYIDRTIKFHTHIDLINNKLSSLCRIMYRLKNRLNLSAAKNLYYTLVYSTATYREF